MSDAEGRNFRGFAAPGHVGSAESLPPPDPALLMQLLDSIPARVEVIDRDGRFVYLNHDALVHRGLPAEQVVGRHVRDVMGTQAYGSYGPVIKQLYAGQSFQWEGWNDYPVHGRRFMQEWLIPYARDGQVQAVISFSRDLTEMKQQQQALADQLAARRHAEALKSAIVDHALAGLVSTDGEGLIVEFNPAAEAMFGASRDSVLGRPVAEVLIPERHRDAHTAGMRRLGAGQAPRMLGQRVEMSALRADGSEFPIEMVLWRTEVGGVAHYTASITDRSEQQRAADQIARQREQLRQSEKLTAMGSLLAGVAHELNNPLAIVMGRASLLEDELGAGPHAADATRIREAAERCARIVRTFLNMARSRPAQRAPVVLNDLVSAAVDMLQYGLRSHGIAVACMLDPMLPPIHADGDQIGQIVLNLIVNAQQALAGASAPKQLHIRTGRQTGGADDGAGVWLRVGDNGRGVAPAMRERIFEPFFTTKAEGVGTGLGLAVSRAIAREHGGELLLEDADEGALFCLRLPLNGAAGCDAVAGTVDASEADGERCARVLVVDDEIELAELMRTMLESAGHEVASAESGALALELLATARFDAVVCDLRMPDMDGFTLWRKVEAAHPALAKRWLFVTGDTLNGGVQRLLAETGRDCIEKPFSKAELLQRVQRLLDG